jgi:hypothetical protein
VILFGVGAAAGAAAAGHALGAGRLVDDVGPVPVARLPEPVRVWLWRARHTRARAIDAATGRGGYYHCTLDLAELDADGRRLIVDALPRRRAHRHPWDGYAGVEGVAVELAPLDGAEVYGAARTLIGTPYTLAAYGPGRGLPCSGLVYHCLPAHLRARVHEACGYEGPAGTVSPNQLAAALGVLEAPCEVA